MILTSVSDISLPSTSGRYVSIYKRGLTTMWTLNPIHICNLESVSFPGVEASS